MKDLEILLDKTPIGATVTDFWHWAYSNITTPVIRGVLLEYALYRYLIKNIDKIVLERIHKISFQSPAPGDLEKSLSPFYKTQPHGDVFDLQLAWGVTIEIKSTSSTKNWRLSKTCRWSLIENKNKKEKKFPAQYYILAILEKEPSINEGQIDLTDVVFYVCTGRALDKCVHEDSKSIGFSKFSKISERCKIDSLADKLYQLQAIELQRAIEMLEPNWKQLAPPSYREKYLPLAIEKKDKTITGWFLEKQGKLENVLPVDVKWLADAEPDWRDWEAVGFKYEPQL